MKSNQLINSIALFMFITVGLCITSSTVSGKDKNDDLIMTEKQKRALDTGSLETYSKEEWKERRKVLERFVPRVGETAPDFLADSHRGRNSATRYWKP